MDDKTLLLRHVKSPNFIQADFVISSVFEPRKTDNGLLSVYDGSRITPEDSVKNQTVVFHSPSFAVVGIECRECKGLGPGGSYDLRVEESPVEGCPEHVHIDFNVLPSRSAFKVATRDLCQRSKKYGILWK